jgi:uncharacterized protein (DUF1330 family)
MSMQNDAATKPAYFIAEVEIHDSSSFKSYVDQFAGTLAPYGGRLLSFGESIVPIEGIEKTTARAAIVVFPSAQAERDWFASPTYQKIAPIRRNSARTRAFSVEGLPSTT